MSPKKVTIAFIFMVLSGTSLAAKPEGFRDLKWGVERSAVSVNWVKVGEDKKYHLVKYKRTGDKMVMGDPSHEYRAPLTELSYGFYQGRLAKVYFSSKGGHYRNGILSELAKNYGKGKKTGSATYYWKTKKTFGSLLCVDQAQLCIGTLKSRKIEKEIKKYKKKLKKQGNS